MSDTRSPPPTKLGISFSMRVVFPLPDQPAKPKIFTAVILGRRSAARAARPGGAAQAVLAEGDAAPERGVEVEIEDAERPAGSVGGGGLEHLVEIGVVEASVPPAAEQVAAHYALGRGRVERGGKLVE